MLIQLGVNKELAKCHSLARRIPGSLVVWSGSRSSYELVRERKYQTRIWAAGVVAGASLYGLNAGTAYKSEDLVMSILCGFFWFATTAVAASSLGFRENGSDCAAFLNGLISIGNECEKDNSFGKIDRAVVFLLVKLMTRALIVIRVAYPWLFAIVAMYLPCSPLNMFSSVIGWCGGSGGGEGTSSGSWLARVATSIIGIAVPHFLFWSAFFSQGIIECVHIVLGSLCQKSLLQLLSSNRGSSDFPSQLKLYRGCQLLNICFGNYCSSAVLGIVAALTVGEISVTYLVLKILGGYSDLLLLIKVMLIGLCPALYLFHLLAAGEAAALNTISVSVLTKSVQSHVQSKLTRRQIRSLWPLRVQLGGNNFIEASTTLILLDFTLRRLVDLLLIGG